MQQDKLIYHFLLYRIVFVRDILRLSWPDHIAEIWRLSTLANSEGALREYISTYWNRVEIHARDK